MTKDRAPTAPGDCLRDLLLHEGISQADLADAMAAPPQAVKDIIAGKRAITPELALRLEMVLGVSAELWLNLQRCVDLARARARLIGSAPHLRPLRRAGGMRPAEEREQMLYRQDSRP